jgi:hypothetical protein
MPVEIKLSMYEIMMAANVGVMRQVESIKFNMKHKYIDRGTDWQNHVESALSECAMAKFKNVFWCKRERSAPDVGDWEVRFTQYENGRLIVTKSDYDDRQYWLVTGKNGVYKIHGYMMGKDAKQDKYWTDPGTGVSSYFVPQSDLIME